MSKSTVERPVEQQPQTIGGTLRHHTRYVLTNWVRELALLPAIIILVIVGAFENPAFLTADNLITVAQLAAPLGVVVVAETLILLTGKFDLSLQSTYGLAPMVGAWLIVSKDGQGLGTNWNPYLGIALCCWLDWCIGAFNGFMVIKLGFNAFIFTLGMLILLAGIQVGIVNGRTIYHMPDEFIYLGSASLFSIPVSVWVTGIIFLVAGAVPALSPGWTRYLCDWRQHRGGAVGGHSCGPHSHRRFHRRQRPGRDCWTDDGRAGCGSHSQPG